MTLSLGIPDMGSEVIDAPEFLDQLYQAIRAQRLYPAMHMESETWAWECLREATIIELGDRQWDTLMQIFRTDPDFAGCLDNPEQPVLWGRTLVHVPMPSWLMTW